MFTQLKKDLVYKFILRLNLVYVVLISFSNELQAQLCNGSLGDPIVNITFGSGANPGPPLSAAATNYKYAPNACPVNGYYTLANQGVECNYGWHILKSDHTGNPNGYFMLVDASFEPSDFYLDTVKNLCANTTYEFAAWILNMKYLTRGIRPNITFSIETVTGVKIQSYNTGDIPVESTAIWRQYGFYFSTPANVSQVVLRMTNNAPGGDGNDLALDDITFRPCGPLITTNIVGSSSNIVDVCENNNNSYTFNAQISAGYFSPVYQWQLSIDTGKTWRDIPGATAMSYSRPSTVPGYYFYRLTVAEAISASSVSCRTASTNVIIDVHQKPIVDIGKDKVLIKGDSVTLKPSISPNDLTYLWAPLSNISNVHILNPIVSPVTDCHYILTATSLYGCTGEDDVFVKVIPGIFVPNAFTPNGDGINDKWEIPFLDISLEADVSVYNNYGQLVYHIENNIVSWDGTFNGQLQPTGVYSYRIVFKSKKLKLNGLITLVR